MQNKSEIKIYHRRLNELRQKINRRRQPTGIQFALKWIKRKRKENTGKVKIVPLSDVKDWTYSEKEGIIRHKKGTDHFFTIKGIVVSDTVDTEVPKWNQPILDQTEGGYLIILCQERNNNIQFLLHAKFEPGNIGYVQFGPTIQATYSNLNQHHLGRKPLFSEYVMDHPNAKIIYTARHNEEGSRFFHKSNVNSLILLDPTEKLELLNDNYIWLSLGEIKHLMLYDNVVNPFVKTILSPL